MEDKIVILDNLYQKLLEEGEDLQEKYMEVLNEKVSAIESYLEEKKDFKEIEKSHYDLSVTLEYLQLESEIIFPEQELTEINSKLTEEIEILENFKKQQIEFVKNEELKIREKIEENKKEFERVYEEKRVEKQKLQNIISEKQNTLKKLQYEIIEEDIRFQLETPELENLKRLNHILIEEIESIQIRENKEILNLKLKLEKEEQEENNINEQILQYTNN